MSFFNEVRHAFFCMRVCFAARNQNRRRRTEQLCGHCLAAVVSAAGGGSVGWQNCIACVACIAMQRSGPNGTEDQDMYCHCRCF